MICLFSLCQNLNPLVWSGRIPQAEAINKQDNATEQQYTVMALVGIVDKQEHARRRQPWTRGFSTSALKGYETLLIKRTLQLVEVLLSQNFKESVDISQWIEFFGYVAVILLGIE